VSVRSRHEVNIKESGQVAGPTKEYIPFDRENDVI
jgi:hypothetical protein